MTTTHGHAPSPQPKDETTIALHNLGPIARSQTLTDNLVPALNYKNQSDSPSAPLASSLMEFPRIIVKDWTGRTLDTFTALQEAIYRARWTRKKMGEWPRTPLEWRLPKAPVPSRPDYSRAAPRSLASLRADIGHPHQQGVSSNSHHDHSTTRRIDLTTDVLVNIPTLEIAVDDVAFVAESLKHLPKIPAFSFLQQSILAGQATYIQIVASILLHEKQLRATEHRDPHWEFPGFCTGCKRAGFCYGCSKNPRPHVHEDVPAKIGGGYRFWKRDRPHDQQDWKHPGNWGLTSAERELRNVIKQYGGLSEYEQAALGAEKEVSRSTFGVFEDEGQAYDGNQDFRLPMLKNLSSYSPYATVVREETLDKKKGSVEEDEEERLDAEASTSDVEGQDKQQKKVSINEKAIRSQSQVSRASEDSADRTLVRVDTGYLEDLADKDMKDERKDQADGKASDYKAEPTRSRQHSRVQTTSSGGRTESSGSQKRSVVTATRKTGRLEYVDKEKELLEEEAMRLRREKAKQSVPFGKKRDDVGYTAPKFFTVQKQSRKITVARDPFSTDRDLNVPKGPAFQLKKSEKKATQFVDFKRSDKGWVEPKKFEVKHEDGTTGSKSLSGADKTGGGKRKGTQGDDEGQDGKSRRKHRQDLSPDSGLDSATTNAGSFQDDSNAQKSGTEDENETNKRADESNERGSNAEKHKRKEKEKKTRKEISTLPESPPPPSLSPEFRIGVTPPLVDSLDSPPRVQTPVLEDPPLPEIDIPAVPELPEREATHLKKKEKIKFTVEPPPQPHPVKEEPKKRRAAPKVRVIPKNLYKARRSRPAEAPVTSEELMDIHDPLDFLARWCIINPDRLPLYEYVFESAIAEQSPRYTKLPPLEQTEVVEEAHKEEEVPQEENQAKEEKEKKSKSKKRKSNKENEEGNKGRELNPNLLPTERGMTFVKATLTIEEQHLEKLIYTLDLLQDKMVKLGNALEELEGKRTKKLASKARETFPVLMSPNYVAKKKKGKKGKKKEKQLSELSQKLKPHEITDSVIVGRLDEKMLNELCREQDMKFLEGEIEILREKIREVQRRVEDIAREKLLTDAFCMNHFFLRQGSSDNHCEDFKRQQSEMYNRLHPTPDYEMNLEEVEESLQQINNHLMTKNEFHFLYNILNLPGRGKINFRLFTVVAALSEKVTQLDPVIRKMINNFNYNALDIKMEKCKELFDLLEMDHMPRGAAQAESLAVELTAGGLKPEHTRYVLNKFNRENTGAIDFLDFVTYVPLFVEIHKRIVQDPLKEDFSL